MNLSLNLREIVKKAFILENIYYYSRGAKMSQNELDNIEKRLEQCSKKEIQLENQLKVVEDPEEIKSIKSQLEKLDELMKHLSQQRIEIIKNS